MYNERPGVGAGWWASVCICTSSVPYSAHWAGLKARDVIAWGEAPRA